MPIVGDAKSVLSSMKKEYGPEKGERIFYATANKQKRTPENWKKKKSAGDFEVSKLGKLGSILLGGPQGSPHADPHELAEGIKEEGEHTPNLEIRKEVAEDHLGDDPKAYTHMEAMAKKHGLSKAAMAGGTPRTPEPNPKGMPSAGSPQGNQGPGALSVTTKDPLGLAAKGITPPKAIVPAASPVQQPAMAASTPPATSPAPVTHAVATSTAPSASPGYSVKMASAHRVLGNKVIKILGGI